MINTKEYSDSYEHSIYQYIEKIESFILEYGYTKEIHTFNKESISISEIELSIKEFLIKEIDAQDYLEIYGTLKDIQDRTIYVCCYEPYGDELLYVEHVNNKLYFFNKDIYNSPLGASHIRYF